MTDSGSFHGWQGWSVFMDDGWWYFSWMTDTPSVMRAGVTSTCLAKPAFHMHQ